MTFKTYVEYVTYSKYETKFSKESLMKAAEVSHDITNTAASTESAEESWQA